MENKELQRAKDRAMYYLGLRDHAAGELYDKLCHKFPAKTAAEAVAEMQRLGLCNDEAFASHRAQYLQNQHKSTREIRQHLRMKGVDKDIIDAVLAESEVPDTDACYALASRKYAAKLAAGEVQKVTAALARRGFGYSDIKNALNRLGAEVAQIEE